MKELERINAAEAPAAVGPYSHAVRYGDMVYTSGQISLKPEDGSIVDGGIPSRSVISIRM